MNTKSYWAEKKKARRRLTCNECGKRCSDKHNLKLHVRAHSARIKAARAHEKKKEEAEKKEEKDRINREKRFKSCTPPVYRDGHFARNKIGSHTCKTCKKPFSTLPFLLNHKCTI